jgi:hypothetical protein
VGRNQAPVMQAHVADITFVVQGLYSNKNGQATVVEWMAIDRVDGQYRSRPLDIVIAEAKVGPRMPNPGGLADSADVQRAQALVRRAVEAGRAEVKRVRQERSSALLDSVKAHQRRLDAWKAQSSALADQLGLQTVQDKRKRQIEATAEAKIKLIERLASEGEPLVRVVAVLVP